MSESISIDLSNYKDRVGARVPEGTYTVLVEDAEPDTARSGNTMINVWFRIQGGEHDGQTIVDRLVLSEKSLFRVVGFMQALGLPTPKKKVALNLRQVIGKVIEIQVEDGDPYNGRVKSEVRGYMRPSGKSSSKGKQDQSDLGDLENAGTDEPVQGEVDLENVDLG